MSQSNEEIKHQQMQFIINTPVREVIDFMKGEEILPELRRVAHEILTSRGVEMRKETRVEYDHAFLGVRFYTSWQGVPDRQPDYEYEERVRGETIHHKIWYILPDDSPIGEI